MKIRLLTTAHKADLGPILKRGSALDMANYLISRLIEERDENLVHDHFHPELADPLDVMTGWWLASLEGAGEEFTFRRA